MAKLNRSTATRLWICFGAALLLGLSGCATYHPLPLPSQVQLAPALNALQGSPGQAPLNLATIERLVLLNDPELRSVRAQHRLAQAQMQQARLLPNPSVSASAGQLLSGPGDASAWSAGISQDIKSLITLRPRREAAKAAAGQIDAALLWQEWQTIAKTRMLYIDIVQSEKLIRLLQDNLALLEQRSQRLSQSVGQGTSELAAAAPMLAATADARSALNDAQRSLLSDRQALNAMLGLMPDVAVALAPQLQLPALDITQVRADAQTIERRRPDLVALQLGYQAQEANLRAAVLAQFPTLSFGYLAAQDNSRVRNGGPSLNFDLPIFNRGQAGIAMEGATRQQLRDEYVARVSAAKGEIAALLTAQAQTRAQRAQLTPQLAQAERIAAQASAAYAQADIDNRSFVDLSTAALARRQMTIALDQQLQEQQVAMMALLGSGMPIALPADVIDTAVIGS